MTKNKQTHTEGLDNQERADYLVANSPHTLSLQCVRTRMSRGWDDDKIMSTPATKKWRPSMNHPFKKQNFNRVAIKKGWGKKGDKTCE